ncbi:hypothetical protein BDV93DRAFT_550220 [Ceratobasidium sp. AG-I]|nr:hypothetical protein BDV93DRAFT_550220 [Ceratobasidium sp. AG-I]
MEPPRLPPKRTRPMDPIYDDEGPETPIDGQDDWLYKRQRPINDEHVTRRKPPTRQAECRQPPRPRGRPAAVATSNSSLFAAASKSASSASTRILPGGLPSHTSTGDSEPTWSPWASESSPVKIFWTRAFMSVRSTLADAFRKLVRSRSQKALPAPTMLFDASPRGRVSPIEPVAQPPMRQLPASQPPVQQQPAQLLPAHAFAALSVEEDDLEEVEVDQENMYAAGLSARDMPQTTIALGGHTIQLTPPTSRPRLLSGIHLDIPGDNTWPPRRPLRSITGHAPTESDSTEIDPDAQRRPEFGFRDTTPSIHANSLYNV